MSDKEEIKEKAAIVAVELDSLAGVLGDLVDKFNAKVEEANNLIDELNNGVDEEDEESVEPDYLVELDMSDYDPKDFGDELRMTLDLPMKKGKSAKYAPGPSSGQFNSYSGLKPISEEELAVARAAVEQIGANMADHPHRGKLFELSSYRYFLVGEDSEGLVTVRARTGELKRFHQKFDIHQIVEKLEADKPVL
jgi:hypothetical protein